jgi:hypothetical protein
MQEKNESDAEEHRELKSSITPLEKIATTLLTAAFPSKPTVPPPPPPVPSQLDLLAAVQSRVQSVTNVGNMLAQFHSQGVPGAIDLMQRFLEEHKDFLANPYRKDDSNMPRPANS